ncbi:hypothetical protein ACFPGO_01925 [Arcanobacterium canis]|uniref:ABC3 transporter permease protein domain-containing protein n=1 Tax=Arcanobacterium canis TaxID=999183 RepID=A0ABY8FWJ1_9ACTO|nr:hypothetical protein [Arcanobacterium canis]WFM82879.1 hypothetical protein P7079_05600 [Arcanobacterium canis]
MKFHDGFKVVIATLFSLLSIASLFLIPQEINNRLAIASERNPIFAADADQATFAYRLDNTVHQGEFVYVMVLEPLGQTPPPPGLTRWPQHGEAFISPALSHDLDYVTEQFGKVAGYISEQSVLPGEKFIYVASNNRQKFIEFARESNSAYLAQGFGKFTNTAFGAPLYEANAIYLLPLAVITLVVPALVYVRSTRKSLTLARYERQFILEAIGIPPTFIRKMYAREITPPLIMGGVIAASIGFIVLHYKIRLPIVVYTLSTQISTSVYLGFLGIAILTFFGIFIYLTHPANLRIAFRKRQRQRGIVFASNIYGVVLGIALAIAVGQFGYLLPDIAAVLVAIASILFTALGMHAFLSEIAIFFQRLMRYTRLNALHKTIYSYLRSHARATMLVPSISGIFLLVATLLMFSYSAMVQQSFPGLPRPTSALAYESTVICSDAEGDCAKIVNEIQHNLSPDARIALIPDFGDSGQLIIPQQAPLPQDVQSYFSLLRNIYGQESNDLSHVSSGATLLTVMPRDSQATVPSTLRSSPFPLLTTQVGETTQTIDNKDQHQLLWIPFFISLTLIMWILSAIQATVKRAKKEAQEIAPIGALSGTSTRIARAIALRALTTEFVANALALALALFISHQIVSTVHFDLPLPFLIFIAVALTVNAIVSAAISAYYIPYFAYRWIPGKEQL